jgi:flagellar basal-body rod modification protein FlgD
MDNATMQTLGVQAGSTTGTTPRQGGLGAMSGQDFFRVLVAQLANQDPLEPTSSQELLQQMSSIREIELSSTLTDSLKTLTGQQQFGAGATMIGQYVVGRPGADGQTVSGKVLAVRFETDGRIMLQLDSGADLDMSELATVTSVQQAAQQLVGERVQGIDTRDTKKPEPVEGIVTGVRTDNGEVLLELDSGQDLRFLDVLSVGATNEAT